MEQDRHRSSIIPYLCVNGAESAIAYYSAVFEAKELDRYQDEPGGPIGHVTLEIYGARLFISDEFPEIGVTSPTTLGGTPVAIHVVVPEVDVTTKRATDLGATLLREPQDQPYGERISKIIDPFGHSWMLATLIT